MAIFHVANVAGVDEPLEDESTGTFRIECRDGVASISNLNASDSPPGRMTLKLVRTAMELAHRRWGRSDAVLTWAFSGVSLETCELGNLLRQWDETREPPVLAIIMLTMGEAGDDGIANHITHGLAGFAGHEIAARFADPAVTRDAARNVARLARYALVEGPVRRGLAFRAVGGKLLDLVWSPASATKPEVVTIIL